MSRAISLKEFEAQCVAQGAKPRHLRRIWRAWLGRCAWEPSPHEAFPKTLSGALDELRGELEGLARVLPVQSAQNDCLKLLVGLKDGNCVEAVLLPREALCLSTQVGCAVGCLFCMTGQGGLVRQLSSAEIVAEFIAALKLRPTLKKVVFMGMGEPSHNLENVRQAVEFIGDVAGLAHKEIVVSSIGDRRLFEAMPTWTVRPAFALSLHTTDNAKRRRLLPRSPDIPVEELLERTLTYAESTKYPAQIEWTLMRGINDSIDEVERLADLIEGRYAMVNFIAVNPVKGSGYERPDNAHMQELITVLRRRGTVATIRESAAQDVEGGCGQLRARVLGEES